MKARDAISLIEAAYRSDVTTPQWLEGIAGTAANLLGSERAMAFEYDASADDWVQGGLAGFHGFGPDFARALLSHPDMQLDGVKTMVAMFRSIRFDSLRQFAERSHLPIFDAVLDRYQLEDLIGVNGIDPSRRGCFLVVAGSKQPQQRRTVRIWHRLGAHIAAGHRLRAVLDEIRKTGADSANSADAVLAPNGKIEHATEVAEPRIAREALRNALVRIDAARSQRSDPESSVELWRGLVAARWSLIEHFERDGRRYYLAFRNDPNVREDFALTTRERQVLAFWTLGQSNKLSAYTLGLSTTTVSELLRRARGKIEGRLRNREVSLSRG